MKVVARTAALLFSWVAAGGSLACGGATQIDDAGRSAGDDGGAGHESDAATETGETECSLNGLWICGGAHTCAPPPSVCTCLPPDSGFSATGPTPCIGSSYAGGPPYTGCSTPPDGLVCVDLFGLDATDPSYDGVPFDLGRFYSDNGAGDRVTYADHGRFTGAPLPNLADCPVIDNVDVCGGYCGGCPIGESCTGRSPLHPYGVCADERLSIDRLNQCGGGYEPCPSGYGCFSFTVEPEMQSIADAYGFCLPMAKCEATAAKLPGGGTCTP